MAEASSGFWRSLVRRLPARDDSKVVLDRRQGERRRHAETVDVDRRREDRRQPVTNDLGDVIGFLGEGASFNGHFTFDGAFRVDGRLAGEFVRGEVLIVGERGQVDAEIQVEILQVRGKVRGDITARRWTELMEPSHVTGTIRTPRLTIWKGAVLKGQCEMPTTSHPSDAGTPPPRDEGTTRQQSNPE
jgi:cytoskeletal protein CcmA (bactofilin family)